MKRLTAFGVLVAMLLLYASPLGAAGMKVAYVDLQRALLEVGEGKLAKTKLKVYFDEKQTLLDAESERLKKMKEDLDRQDLMIDPSIKAAKEDDLQKALIELQKLYMKLNQELKQKEQEAVAPILEKMQAILTEVAEERGYDLILDKNNSGIIYAPMKFDITADLIRIYDERYPVSASAFKKAKDDAKNAQ
jgi:outer membrane protein